MEALVVAALKRFVVQYDSFTIHGKDGSPYLTRWYVFPKRTPDENRTTPFGVYINFFHRSDTDEHDHNHPWDHAVAIVLAGGYVERRGDQYKTFLPGDVNIIAGNDFHRVKLLDEKKGSWSLFIAGQRFQNWGFKTSDGVIPWRKYLGL